MTILAPNEARNKLISIRLGTITNIEITLICKKYTECSKAFSVLQPTIFLNRIIVLLNNARDEDMSEHSNLLKHLVLNT